MIVLQVAYFNPLFYYMNAVCIQGTSSLIDLINDGLDIKDDLQMESQPLKQEL